MTEDMIEIKQCSKCKIVIEANGIVMNDIFDHNCLETKPLKND